MVSKQLNIEQFETVLHAKAREIAGIGEAEVSPDRPYAQLVPADTTGAVDPASEINMGILRDIDYALDRMRDGDYGICEDCGKEIPEARLLAVPWARQCFECEKLLEASA